MTHPLVTVVTPSYNQGRFIRATIESVLSQDYPNLEYIVMDGGSTDETAAVVSEYASRLTWISEKDRGQTHAINKGFRMARGSIVGWMNSDDIALPGAIGHAVKAFGSNPDAGAVYGEGYTIDADGKVTGRFTPTERYNLWKLVYVWDYVLQQTVYFRKSALEEIGYLNESLHWSMDWDVLIRLGMRFPLVYIPEDMGALREYMETKTASGAGPRFRELVRLLRTHGGHTHPPGYYIYGLDTYERVFWNAVRRWSPAALEPLITRAHGRLSPIVRRRIDRFVHESQGWYTDGWAGPRMEALLPIGTTRVRIRGLLHDIRPALAGQQMQVACEDWPVTTIALSPGEFDVVVDLPPAARPDRCRSITLTAARTLVPSASGVSPDSRRLAYVIHGVERA